MKKNYFFITLGILWTVVFAGMSFYWGMGGRIGARSLGGAIYEMSQNPSSSFLTIVWLTGVVKLFGLILFLMLFIKWKKSWMTRLLYYTMKVVGVILFLYGFLNFFTITLSAFNLSDFDLDAYAIFWRLVFWEPFWMIGGVFYFFAVRKY